MLYPREAIDLVLRTASRGEPIARALADSVGLVSAGDIQAERGYPFFSFSAVDGYAVRCEDLAGAGSRTPVFLPLGGEVRAAASEPLELAPSNTIRIMTGGALPGGADAVVMRENTKESATGATFFSPVAPGLHINRQGEEIRPGEVLQPAGVRLTAPAMGLLATLGIARLKVYPPPAVALLATGDELVAPGQKLLHGQVYDSISPMLGGALSAAGIAKILKFSSPDDAETMFATLSSALDRADIVLTVGGVSMGDYDLLAGAFQRAGVEKVFWKVAQKPGKPLFFGRAGGKLVFGLPGNPASALVCFNLYVLPAIRHFMGWKDPAPHWLEGLLAEGLENPDSSVNYIRGNYVLNGSGDFILQRSGRQGSYMLGSFAYSRALIEMPAGPVSIGRNSRVRFLPHFWESLT